MKKLSTIIMALALVLGMSQCKKQETPTNGNGGEKVHITLNVDNGESLAVNVNDNGSRHDMSPRLGMVKFENGDVLHVGYNGQYFGQLTYQNGAFSGDLDEPAENVQKPLHFYFLGGKGKGSDSPSANATSFTFSIADQHDVLPVLCYGASNETYGSVTKYSAVLEYKCALVRFDLANHGEDYPVTLSGVPTQVTVNFANPDATTAIVAAANQTNVNMTLYGEPGNAAYRWAILLKGTNLDNAEGLTIGSTVTNHVMDNNTYINSGISINNPKPVPAAPNVLYAVHNTDGLTQFSVSVDKKVYFSKANLMCNAADLDNLVWSFHDYQFDESPDFYFSNNNSGPTGNTGVPIGNVVEMDRFTWGLNDLTKVTETDYVDGSRNLSRADGNDWGCALIGTDYGDHWRTLTAGEWLYLLSSRTGKRFLRATWKQMHPVNSKFQVVNGIFIAPDGYDGGSTSSYTEWNQADKIHSFSGTGYINLVNELLNAGCVFLPALGDRYNNYYYEYNYHTASGNYMRGNYWTATGVAQQPGSSQVPRAMAFRFTEDAIDYTYSPQRNRGMCVRLVWDAN